MCILAIVLFTHCLPMSCLPERACAQHTCDICRELMADLSMPDIEGIYETQVTLEFRTLLKLGCVCAVEREEARKMAASGTRDLNTFFLGQLKMLSLAQQPYLKEVMCLIYSFLKLQRYLPPLVYEKITISVLQTAIRLRRLDLQKTSTNDHQETPDVKLEPRTHMIYYYKEIWKHKINGNQDTNPHQRTEIIFILINSSTVNVTLKNNFINWY